jgi:hypothetical protein
MPMFGFFQPPSEEEQKQMQEAFERHRMSVEEFQHSFQRLFEELDEDQLKTIRTAFHALLDTTGSPLAGQWEGMVAWQLKTRFNICVTCGVDHDKELSDQNSHVNIPQEFLEVTPPEEVAPLVIDKRIAQDGLTIFAPLSTEQRSLADKYHLDDLRDQDTNELLGFYCTGINGMKGPCGMKYPSIEDRMLREPEHCSGCFQRMAQG